jgi:hypothetical protein
MMMILLLKPNTNQYFISDFLITLSVFLRKGSPMVVVKIKDFNGN